MNKIVVVFMIVILAGCSPQKRLARLLDRYPLSQDTVIEYRDTTIWRDTTITRLIPGDTVFRDTLIPFEVDLPDTELKTTSTFAEASAGIRSNVLWLELIQYDTVFVFKLDSALRQDIDTVFVEVVKEVPTLVKQSSFWKHGFLVLAGLILIGLCLWFLLKR
jgi:hypothetical protein